MQMAGKGFKRAVCVVVEKITHNPGAVGVVAAVHVGHIRGGGVVAHQLGKQDGDKAGGNPVGVLVGSGQFNINIQKRAGTDENIKDNAVVSGNTDLVRVIGGNHQKIAAGKLQYSVPENDGAFPAKDINNLIKIVPVPEQRGVTGRFQNHNVVPVGNKIDLVQIIIHGFRVHGIQDYGMTGKTELRLYIKA